MKLSLIQMKVEGCKQENYSTVTRLIAGIKDPGVVVLPEMWVCPYDISLFPSYAETEEGETASFLSETARKFGIYLVGGSVPEISQGLLYNTCYVFNTKGERIALYRKIHLFDVVLPTGHRITESKTLTPGNAVALFSLGEWKAGVIICFDLRFPEILRTLEQKGAEVVMVPSVFSVSTGKEHWEGLLRIRAVDNQIYIAGVSPAREETALNPSYANSMIVDPWGKVINRGETQECVVSGTLDKTRIRQIRQEFPLRKQYRREGYEENLLFLKKEEIP